ncbi:MAG: glycosyltransferase family 4 protein [Caulobacteraceae bacterium]
MPSARDYFIAERYRGLSLRDGWPPSVAEIIEPDLEDALSLACHADSPPLESSQELFLATEPDVAGRYASGEIRFPFYDKAGPDSGWKATRRQSPYVEKLARSAPDLSIALVEQLWVERAAGMPGALPGPSDRRSRWRTGSSWMVDIEAAGVRSGAYAAAIVTPRHGIGGGEKTAREVASAFERLTGRPSLIIVADTAVPPGELPVDVICLPNLEIRGEAFLRLPPAARAEILGDLLLRARVPRVLAVNSHLANTLFQTETLQMAGVKCGSVLFCIGLGPGGAAEGYIRVADWLIDDGVVLFTDNHNVARILSEQFFYDDTVVLAMPADVALNPIPSGPSILWAGRIDDQKRPDLLVDVAAAAPHLTFEVWGAPVLSQSEIMQRIFACPNILYRGGFNGFETIDLTNVGCLLYTSDFDGTPNLLLEAMGRGLACVCSAVGGVPDLMAGGRGVLMDREASPAAWAKSLRALLADDAARRTMAAAAREHIRLAHSREAFDATAARLLAAL